MLCSRHICQKCVHVTLTHRQLAYPAFSGSKSMNDAFSFFGASRQQERSSRTGTSHFSISLKTYEHLSIKNLALAAALGTCAVLPSTLTPDGKAGWYRGCFSHAAMNYRAEWRPERCSKHNGNPAGRKKKSHFSQEVTEKAEVIYHTVTRNDFKDHIY